MTFNKPNLNAPRFRSKCATILTNDLFLEFKKKFPEYAELDLKQFKQVVMGFNGAMVEGIRDNRDGVELPEGLGYVFMGTCPKASTKDGKRNIDFKKSQELGIVVTHQNWESNNKLLKIFYSNLKTRYKLANREIWSFRLAKHHRSSLSEHYKVHWTLYRIIENAKRISALFEAMKRSEYKSPIAPDYNEFKLNEA